MHLIKKQQSGFTLIEMIVSLALFSVVVTVAIGALLVLVQSNDDLQGEQSVMTNLSFALDSMTREIRTGTRYYCHSRPSQSNIFSDSNSLEALGSSVQDCPNGLPNGHDFRGIAFLESGESITGASASRILYYYDRDAQQLFRRVGDNDAQSLVSSGIAIIDANFYVTGADSVETGNDVLQPTVTIQLEAIDENDPSSTPVIYYLQTTITQRTLDL